MSHSDVQPQPGNFSLKGILKMVRWPNLLIIAVSQYLSAIFLIGPSHSYLTYVYDPQLFLICLGTVLIAAGGYIINDYYDVKIDYINKPGKVVVGNLLKRRVAMFIHVGLNILGVIMGLLVSLKIAAINVLAAIWLWGYSNQLKRMAFVGNLSVAILSAMAIAIIGIHYQPQENLIYIYSIFAFYVSIIREIIKDIEDLKGDATFGCQTLPVVWGIRSTKKLVFLLIVLFSISMVLMAGEIKSERVYIYFAVMILPALAFVYKLWTADTIRHFRNLSMYLKLFMLLGIISMTLV
jgi:4-hydroxybenzoate polyprenyltransferase